MSNTGERILPVSRYYDSLNGMKRKYDRLARQEAFSGTNVEEWTGWKNKEKKRLWELLGMDKMEICSPCPEIAERVMLDGGILREKLLLQVEPDIWMPVYLLIPPGSGRHSDCVLAPHGHQGAGKYSVAGCSEIPAVAEAIDRFHYDYGLYLARLGYVAVCPDARGFGERRDLAFQKDEENAFMRGTCFYLAHGRAPWNDCGRNEYLGSDAPDRLSGREGRMEYRASGLRGLFWRRTSDAVSGCIG